MLLDLLELASNKTLEHDQNTQARLDKLRGKTMTLQIRPINQSISVTPHKEGLEFSNTSPEKVDVTLSATIGAMIKISRDGMENAELEPGELEISGDPIVGQRFAQVISELDIDWQGLLSERLGESPASAITFAAGQAKIIAEDSRDKLKGFFKELITNDLGLMADRSGVEQFLDDVDTLRADTDRLQARLNHLQSKS